MCLAIFIGLHGSLNNAFHICEAITKVVRLDLGVVAFIGTRFVEATIPVLLPLIQKNHPTTRMGWERWCSYWMLVLKVGRAYVTKSRSTRECIQLKLFPVYQELHIEDNSPPEKWIMEDYFPFGMVNFQGRTVKLLVIIRLIGSSWDQWITPSQSGKVAWFLHEIHGDFMGFIPVR